MRAPGRSKTGPHNIIVRPATKCDVSIILALIQELAEYEHLARECVATQHRLRRFLFGKHPSAEVLIAELDGRAVGFALFFSNFSTFLARPGVYLEDLFVREAVRGKGVGKALLARIAHLAVARGCGRFEWSVLDWNTPAVKFYEKLGAVPLRDWTLFRITGPALQKLAKSRR